MTAVTDVLAPEQLDTGRPALRIRAGRVAWRWDLRTVTVCTVSVVLTAVVAVAALANGAYSLSPSEVITALLGRADGLVHTVVWDWRLPRVGSSVVFGAALGASGAVFQSLNRNPLASPDVLGFSTGAYTGALLMLITVGGGFVSMATGAFGGGLAVAAAVYLLAYRGGVQGFRMIIVGIAISSMLGSLNTWLILTADLHVAISAAAWGAGSLAGITAGQLAGATLLIVLFAVALAPLAARLKALDLGDDAAAALGVKVERSRVLLMIAGVGLTATATAAAGPIMFVALVAPQLARRLTNTASVTIGASACLGALLLVVADYLALHALGDHVMPVGVVTVTIGGLYLIWLLIREGRRRTSR
ncbi:iron complex transport system permease protein [Brevibacterium sp. Mu109]|uniref:FecCD family ABC transporter permease n=1 Tax=Brevibacterium sp. Mu109 TaxID=1255669 RepID=UPI000C4AA077|nr:iron chelate uptake ABC transporter family permease subunit [Brevibacterium sp. Mu109]SMX87062.1 iron complex transport system permease protein [Brevibacterium sp. Mu109]